MSTPEALHAAGKFCDVVSVNRYTATVSTTDPIFSILAKLDRPVLISEFHFGATDRGAYGAGLQWTADQRSRAVGLRTYAESALAHPFIVGLHWFQYVDQPLTGRFPDGENFGIGMVQVTDLPHVELTEAFRDVAGRLYQLAADPQKQPDVSR